VHELLAKAGLHGLLDTGADKIGYKVRQHSTSKVPVILAVGKREAEERTVSIRRLGSRDQQSLALADAIHTLTNESQPPA